MLQSSKLLVHGYHNANDGDIISIEGLEEGGNPPRLFLDRPTKLHPRMSTFCR